MTPALTRFAPAKVNLGLSVLGRRADGYHDLHSLMVPLTVGDTLTFTPAPDLHLTVQGADLPTDERNLVYRAARDYLHAAGQPGGVHITLHKTLPLASGLGGGSSDAATTLLTLHELYPAPVDLAALAVRLGADVPFFLLGGPALAEGIGERLRALDLPAAALVLLNPGVEVSARDAYTWLGERGAYTPPLDLAAITEALRTGEPVPYHNALQPAVVARHALIGTALAALEGAGLHSPLMSGSGSTCFALAATPAQAVQAAQALHVRYPGWWVSAAETVPGRSASG